MMRYDVRTYIQVAVIWFYQGEVEKFTPELKQILEAKDLFFSPLVKLELHYLYEIKRVREHSQKVIQALYETIGLQILLYHLLNGFREITVLASLG